MVCEVINLVEVSVLHYPVSVFFGNTLSMSHIISYVVYASSDVGAVHTVLKNILSLSTAVIECVKKIL